MTHEQFLRDVAEHEMTVLLDDGVRRHLRFARPGSWCMSFEVVTWQHRLCYTGDVGAFVFSRLPDMFEFFRGRNDGSIDFGYWAEKCLASDRTDGIRRYSEDRFQDAIKADFDSFVEYEQLTETEAADLWQQIEDDVLSAGDNEHDARDAALRFRWAPDGQTRGRDVFPDFWEHRLDDYTTRFVWCCYALRWSIGKYDATREKATA